MKFSYQWLKELSGTKKKPAALVEMVSLKGFEYEGGERVSEKFENFCVGRILEVSAHPNADRLQVTKIDVGAAAGGKSLQIVCGAKNIQAGDLVPVALVGAVVPNKKMEIVAAEIRGVKSFGMLCAEDELGLGKNHEGIMILQRGKEKNILVAVEKLAAGMALAEALGLTDQTLEFSILPNRAHDCLGHRGLAREICALEGRKIQEVGHKMRKMAGGKEGGLKVEIRDKKRCRRYIGAVLEGVKVGAAPGFIQRRLLSAGMEPINNVVDITNYVMLEVGSPLHAFDFDEIKDERGQVGIVVRRAAENESLELLDGKKLTLDREDLVIADREKALALAGIKGGGKSGISEKTEKIVLEAANFDGFWIRKTRQRHNLNTESQARFEKGLSPSLAGQAVFRAAELLALHAGAKLTEVKDVDHSERKTQKISLDFEKAERLLGRKVDRRKSEKILKDLGFGVLPLGKGKSMVSVPEWRLDIEAVADLVEEFGRIEGYENIPVHPISAEIAPAVKNISRQLEWKIKDLLIAQGFDELKSYSFYGEKEIASLGLEKNDHLRLANPLNEESVFLRQCLLPALLAKTSENSRFFDRFKIFELGKVYCPGKERPEEELSLTGVVFDQNMAAEELFVQAKGALEGLFSGLSIEKIDFSPGRESGLYRRGAVGKIETAKGVFLGEIGIISASLMQARDLKKPVAIFWLSFPQLLATSGKEKVFQSLPRFPLLRRDIAFLAEGKMEMKKAAGFIRRAAGETLADLELFDIFTEEKTGQKSLAFHLAFGRSDRTMTGQEADEAMARITLALEKEGMKVKKG